MLKIVLAETDIQYQQVRELLSELSAWDTTQVSRLGLDAQAAMDFYYVSGEEMFPGAYAPPEGRLFFATCSAKAAGCGALRRMTADTCELKRINVRPEFRGKQIGRQLAETLILAAIEAGYSVSNPQPHKLHVLYVFRRLSNSAGEATFCMVFLKAAMCPQPQLERRQKCNLRF